MGRRRRCRRRGNRWGGGWTMLLLVLSSRKHSRRSYGDHAWMMDDCEFVSLSRRPSIMVTKVKMVNKLDARSTL